MNNADEFDDFLKNSFKKINYNIGDEGFTEKVISQLPDKRIFTINKNFILYLAEVLTLISGFKNETVIQGIT